VITAVMPTYGRADVSFARGEGAYLFDTAGRRYLDFTTGIAVVCLGHSHPHLVEEVRRQAGELMHCSNLFRIPGQERLAQRLVDNTFADTVFFGNSGAEANECAIKMVRKYHYTEGRPEKYRIITFTDAFHGRTLATIAATGSAKVLEGFGPKVEGFDHVPFGDLEATAKAITPETGAIMIEPVQGEGGINVLPEGMLEELRALCDQHGLLLVLDEVQSGMGRTGKLLAYQWSSIEPDIATLGKGIGGGFPLGATLATAKAAVGMTPGTHGSTYGGNPMSVAAGNAVLDVMLQDGFMEHVLDMGEKLMSRLKALQRRNIGGIEEVRGRGLFIGIKFHANNGEVVSKLRDAGLLTVPAAQNVVRLLPPLTIDESHIDECMTIIEQVAAGLES
jgi:acetylornithine/N-succinyldiaminopimelate aminotransferase